MASAQQYKEDENWFVTAASWVANRHLKHFTEWVTKVSQPPLLELPEDDTTHGGASR